MRKHKQGLMRDECGTKCVSGSRVKEIAGAPVWKQSSAKAEETGVGWQKAWGKIGCEDWVERSFTGAGGRASPHFSPLATWR